MMKTILINKDQLEEIICNVSKRFLFVNRGTFVICIDKYSKECVATHSKAYLSFESFIENEYLRIFNLTDSNNPKVIGLDSYFYNEDFMTHIKRWVINDICGFCGELINYN